MSEAEKKPETPPSQASSAPGGSGPSKLIIIISIVNLLICLGTSAVLFIQYKKDKAREAITDIDPHAVVADAEKPKDGHGGGGGHGEADPHGGGHGGAKKEEKKQGPQTLALELFTVNLYTPGASQPKYVRANITLELESPEVDEEIKQKMARVRNVIIDLFNSKRASDLQTTTGREFVREEIKGALNQFLKSGVVNDVYFVNIAVTG